jgi:hypothetical protein
MGGFMSDISNSLDTENKSVTMHPFYDAYLSVPFRKKNANAYRVIAKRIGARYDSTEERWWITNSRMRDSYADIIDNNLFYSWKFYYDKSEHSDIYKPNVYLNELPKLEMKKLFADSDLISNVIPFSKLSSVGFVTTKNAEAVCVIFLSGSNHDYFEDMENFFKKTSKMHFSSKNMIVPKDIGRSIWSYYSDINTKNKPKPLDPRYAAFIINKIHGVNIKDYTN